MFKYNKTIPCSSIRTNIYKYLSHILLISFVIWLLLYWIEPVSAAGSAFQGFSGSSDPDMDLYKQKMGQAFTFAYKCGVFLAGLYYVSAVIRYFTEDSGDSARKHLIGATCALFIATSALPLVNFILNGFFPTADGYQDMADGTQAITLVFLLLRRMITLMLNIGIAMGVFYLVVAALKYAFSNDSGENAKSHMIRVLFGVFLLVIGRTVLSAFIYWFAG